MSSQGFFDMREKMLGSRGAAQPADKPKDVKPLSVSQLTRQIDSAIKAGVPGTVRVQGEVSNFNLNRASGHAYFTMKDANACLDCVMFASDMSRVKFRPGDGMELLAAGSVKVYAQRGRYQLYVNSLEPIGQGALELAFKQLHAKLQAEGLFEADRKKPILQYPQHLAIVTSRQAAGFHDMLKVLQRYPFLKLSIYHVPVQGDGCGKHIAAALVHINRSLTDTFQPDVILLGRGGGSLEDLWGFNDEAVARAIAASHVPVVTGIGHEVDTSIADLVADHHAHTPTEAATVVTAYWQTIEEELAGNLAYLLRSAKTQLTNAQQQLISIERHEFFRKPTQRLNELRMQLDDRQRALLIALQQRATQQHRKLQTLADRLERNGPAIQVARTRGKVESLASQLQREMANQLKHRDAKLTSIASVLEAVNPQRVLARGYSMTFLKKTNTLVKDKAQLKPGDRIVTRLSTGEVESTVQDGNQGSLFES